MKLLKKAVYPLLAALLVSSFAACSPAATEQPTPEKTESPAAQETDKKEESKMEEGKAEQTVITYWTWESEMEKIDERFTKAHPEIKREITKVGSAGDYTTKIQQTVASGSELPDILLGESNQRGALFAMDIWEDLSAAPYNAKFEDYFDYAKERCTNPEGKLVGIEQSVSPSAMAYKRDITTKYFGTDDRAKLEEQFKSFDDLIAAAKTVQEKSGGKDFLFSSSGLVMDWLYSADPTSNVNEAGEIDFTKKMTPILEKVCALRDAGGIDTFTNWTPQANAAYADENHIFFPCANWAIVFQVKANDAEGSGNWGLMLPPGGGYSHGGTTMGINKDSKNKEAAWTYIDWYTNSQDGVQAVKEIANYFVPTKKFYEDSTYTSIVDPFFKDQDIGSVLYDEIAPVLNPAPISRYDTVVADVMSLLSQSIMSDAKMDAAMAVAKGVEEIKNKLPDVTVK